MKFDRGVRVLLATRLQLLDVLSIVFRHTFLSISTTTRGGIDVAWLLPVRCRQQPRTDASGTETGLSAPRLCAGRIGRSSGG